jgi:hypothetical protein
VCLPTGVGQYPLSFSSHHRCISAGWSRFCSSGISHAFHSQVALKTKRMQAQKHSVVEATGTGPKNTQIVSKIKK